MNHPRAPQVPAHTIKVGIQFASGGSRRRCSRGLGGSRLGHESPDEGKTDGQTPWSGGISGCPGISTDNAEVGGSIPPSPTKTPGERPYFA
jgi:hypothetical protein